jgi:hypothetical protein
MEEVLAHQSRARPPARPTGGSGWAADAGTVPPPVAARRCPSVDRHLARRTVRWLRALLGDLRGRERFAPLEPARSGEGHRRERVLISAPRDRMRLPTVAYSIGSDERTIAPSATEADTQSRHNQTRFGFRPGYSTVNLRASRSWCTGQRPGCCLARSARLDNLAAAASSRVGERCVTVRLLAIPLAAPPSAACSAISRSITARSMSYERYVTTSSALCRELPTNPNPVAAKSPRPTADFAIDRPTSVPPLTSWTSIDVRPAGAFEAGPVSASPSNRYAADLPCPAQPARHRGPQRRVIPTVAAMQSATTPRASAASIARCVLASRARPRESGGSTCGSLGD